MKCSEHRVKFILSFTIYDDLRHGVHCDNKSSQSGQAVRKTVSPAETKNDPHLNL